MLNGNSFSRGSLKYFRRIIFYYLLLNGYANAQQSPLQDTTKFRTVSAGAEYEKSSWHQFLWGSNYRKEWTTPVTVPVILLDTAKGGLKPYEAGGGHQTKSLHLKTANEKEYTLRSVNKTLAKVLPEILWGTFAEKQVNDEVSMSHPYAASAVPFMAERANIYHTNPRYVYLPKQSALDTFNNTHGDNLYLFEQKVAGNWKEADNLGNFENFYSTEEVLKKIYDNNRVSVDQQTFIKERIFDWFIGDWDRHEDQWEWGERKNGDAITYVPVPQDRDQAFSKHNGLLLNFGMSAGGLFYMQPFDDDLKDVRTFTYEERNLDRFFTNEMTLDDWQNAAKELQRTLTDEVITESIRQLPPEVFSISGEELISKLRSRRGHLVEWATTYYRFLAEQVQVIGSKQKEYFEVSRSNNGETSIKVYRLADNGNKIDSPFFERTFNPAETKEVRLFGLGAEDVYKVEGDVKRGMVVRIIGGDSKDLITDSSGGTTHIYDDKNNVIEKGDRTKLHLSSDTSVHDFKYDWYRYDKKGIVPYPFYSNEDHVYIGLGYFATNFAWRKEPFASRQLIDVHYSISEKAFSVIYNSLIPHLIGNWDLSLKANYDAIRWTHFFGLGNETQFTDGDIYYYTTRTREWFAQPAVIRRFGKNTVTISGFLKGSKVIDDTSRYLSKTFAPPDADFFHWKNFGGAEVNYSLEQINDSILPTRGIVFSANALGARNLESSQGYMKYSTNLQLYIPLVSKFYLRTQAGAITVTGHPEFYQYASIGGQTLRGFRRDRFWGKTAFYNTNEVRFISNVKSYIFNGKAGLLAFFDNGRVWMPGENSETWHTGYGGGLILAPFNFISAYFTYGISKDERLWQVNVRFNKLF
ncbi:MAG TPA: hypothetical protein VEV83_05620 [Parafilimonas sp.]|nr:hypothetical protein [Parafilimonas sp.]